MSTIKIKNSKRKQIDRIFIGLFIILFATFLILNGAGVFAGLNLIVSPYTILMTLLFAWILFHSIGSVSFAGIGFAVGHLLHLYRDIIGIPNTLSSWLLILASLMIGVGFDYLFKGLKRTHHPKIEFEYSSDDDKIVDEPKHKVFYSSDSKAKCENTFGKTTRYITSNDFVDGKFENAFGNLTIYFEDVVLRNKEGFVSLDNAFGSISLYLPKEWNINLREDSSFGPIHLHGTSSSDPDAPILNVDADNAFGSIDIYFN